MDWLSHRGADGYAMRELGLQQEMENSKPPAERKVRPLRILVSTFTRIANRRVL